MIAHETVRPRARKRGSARAFGLTFAAVFAVLGLFPLIRHGQPRGWLIVAALVLALLAVAAPRILDAPNRAWLWIGERLSVVTSTVLIGVIYFVVVTPMGIIARLRGKDPLRKRFESNRTTYWISRDRADLTAESLTRQF